MLALLSDPEVNLRQQSVNLGNLFATSWTQVCLPLSQSGKEESQILITKFLGKQSFFSLENQAFIYFLEKNSEARSSEKKIKGVQKTLYFSPKNSTEKSWLHSAVSKQRVIYGKIYGT